MHACSGYEPRPQLFVDMYGGCNYLASAEWWSYTSLPFFEDSRQIIIIIIIIEKHTHKVYM